MSNKNILKFTLLLIATSTFLSCAKSDKNDLKEAQLCLNSSAPSAARACINKISGIQTAQANKLRCAAIFISEGYNTPASFIAALDQLNGTSGGCAGGCSPTIGAISALTFKNANNLSATDRTRSEAVANEAFGYCSQADTNIYMQIASLFKIGTFTANIAYQTNGGATPTPDQIKTAIASLPDTDMGALATQTYGATCQDTTNASDSTKKYCAELGAAVNGGGTQAEIGACLKAKLANPGYSNPTAKCP